MLCYNYIVKLSFLNRSHGSTIVNASLCILHSQTSLKGNFKCYEFLLFFTAAMLICVQIMTNNSKFVLIKKNIYIFPPFSTCSCYSLLYQLILYELLLSTHQLFKFNFNYEYFIACLVDFMISFHISIVQISSLICKSLNQALCARHKSSLS